MSSDDALSTADRLIDALLRARPKGEYGGIDLLDLGKTATGKAILQSKPDERAAIVTSALERLGVPIPGWERSGPRPRPAHDFDGPNPRGLVILVLRALLRRKLPLTEPQVLALLGLANEQGRGVSSYWGILSGVVSAAANRAEADGLSGPLREATLRLVEHVQRHPEFPDFRRAAERLSALLTEGPHVTLQPGEAWSDAALEDLGAMPPSDRHRWNELLAQCQAATGTKPSASWLKEASATIEAIGFPAFKRHVLRWFPLVARPRTAPFQPERPWLPDQTDMIQPAHVDLLKGLVRCCGLFDDRELAQALSHLTLSAYRKIPALGPRLVTLGNACVTALRMMPGTAAIGAFALLKVKVTFGKAQKEIEKALTALADRGGLSRNEIEELGVPAYGFEEVGERRDTVGEHIAELTIENADVVVRWLNASGQPLKSLPASLKKAHGEEVRQLQAAAKDAARMLSAQRARIDGLYLASKSWPFEAWRERYLDHPLVGTIARSLIWRFTTDRRTVDGIWHGGRIVGRDDRDIERLGPKVTVALWHPIENPVDDVLGWRAWLDEHHVRQPFKQAHREVYILTGAELKTRVYSNRFAAHILRQHQYHALCAARGWKDQLRLMVNTEYPPTTRLLPEWGLRAEFWVEGAGHELGRDTNETGTFLYLATDQVRFYSIDAAQWAAHACRGGYQPGWRQAHTEPIALAEMPPLVFSEIMRDVDLFVGVASVGNDATWSDGGPDGCYRDYWHGYSFGELSATAQTRRAVLERLIPRLKIASRCSFNERFLIVKGDLRTYKIHLGSGNILMEPNDHYLCIVPKQVEATNGERLFLPFEGDGTLSVILSKALLLADDKRITDPTINAQIRPGR